MNSLDILNGVILNLKVDSNLTINGVPIDEYINNLIIQYAKDNSDCEEDTPPIIKKTCADLMLERKIKYEIKRTAKSVALRTLNRR